MLTDPNEKSITKDQKRMSRRQFRKERKLATRKAFRQYYAQKRDRKQEQSIEEEKEALKQHSEYLQQKRLWEEREERYNLINSVRRKAEEEERKARERAKVKIIIITTFLFSLDNKLMLFNLGYVFLTWFFPCSLNKK